MNSPDYAYMFANSEASSSSEKPGSNSKFPSSSAPPAAAFDEMAYGLDPAVFQNPISFQMPAFLSAAGLGHRNEGPTYLETDSSRFLPKDGKPLPIIANTNSSPNRPLLSRSGSSVMTNTFPLTSNPFPISAKKAGKYVPTPNNPVYGPYGSSVIELNPDLTPFAKSSELTGLSKMTGETVAQVQNMFKQTAHDPKSPPAFDPLAAGLPRSTGDNFPGLYSASGFDMVGVLARVAARPNPQINVGPVDTSTSFLVVDARRYDFPIVFASETFAKLTGYDSVDVIGRNCRFLQDPDGQVEMGNKRSHTDGDAVYHMKTHILAGKETQTSLINYKKDKTPFINLVTIVPITWDTDDIAYFVGFQVDLVEQPNTILARMQNGTYTVNYTLIPNNSQLTETPKAIEQPVQAAQAGLSNMAIDEPETDTAAEWERLIVENSKDHSFVLSQRGVFLYASASLREYLEVDNSLNSEPIASFVDANDAAMIIRELTTLEQPGHISLCFRFNRRKSGPVYVEASGRSYSEPGRSRRAIIFTARERPTPKLSLSSLQQSGGFGQIEYWSKLSVDGLHLQVTRAVEQVAGFKPAELIGTSIFELAQADCATEIRQALQKSRDGSLSGAKLSIKRRRGGHLDVYCTFYPVHSSCPDDQDGQCNHSHHGTYASSNSPTRAEFAAILCQTNTFESEQRRHRSRDQKSVNSGPHTNLFHELECNSTCNWQFELEKTKMTNRRLKKEIAHVERQLQKKRGPPSNESSSTSRRKLEESSVPCVSCGQPVAMHGGKGSLCTTCSVRWQSSIQSQAMTATNSSSSSDDIDMQ